MKSSYTIENYYGFEMQRLQNNSFVSLVTSLFISFRLRPISNLWDEPTKIFTLVERLITDIFTYFFKIIYCEMALTIFYFCR